MSEARICPECRKPLAPNAPQGLCPECLIKAGLGTGVDLGSDTHAASGRQAFLAPAPEELARLFPQLEILGLIGQGGMGVVYKARQRDLDRVVALKILPLGGGTEATFAERFTREARALAKLNHPGIVTLYEFGKADGLYFFLMEFVDGVNLGHLLEVERISPREALAIVPRICDALQYAHDQGIVHRDIKPENILLDRQGRVKVADFGLAKLMGSAALGSGPSKLTDAGTPTAFTPGTPPPAAVTEADRIMGTPPYMAPEQQEHPTEVDHRADIYALGVVFYRMLTGELPRGRIEPPSHKVQVDVRIDQIVMRALEKAPELRYQTVADFGTQIQTVVNDATPPEPERRAKPSPPGFARTAIAALLLSLGGPLLALLLGLVLLHSWAWVYGAFFALETVALAGGIVAWERHTAKAAVALAAVLILAWIPGTIRYAAQSAPRRTATTASQKSAGASKLARQTNGLPGAEVQPTTAGAAAERGDVSSGWLRRLEAINQSDWRGALATAQQVAGLPGLEGIALVRQHWTVVTNAESRKQFLKAFVFANHPQTLEVLHLGLQDPALPVQNWALTYLKDIALQDYAEDHAAALAWTSAHTNRPLPEALGESARDAAARWRILPAGTVRGQVECLRNSTWFRTFPQALVGSDLRETLEALISGRDEELVREAVQASASLPADEAWSRRVLLPLLVSSRSAETRGYAARALGQQAAAWAIDPLLAGLTNMVSSADAEASGAIWNIASALAEIGSPQAIPTMIGVIAADNTYNTVYGVGYFGLGKLTGVKYDASHDGAWWRAWWDKNKQRFSAEVQALEIPQLPARNAPSRSQAAPPDEFGDLTVGTCLAGGDTNKLYYLIQKSGSQGTAPPQSSLLLVLPGGDGGTNFHPFIKRLAQQAVPSDWLVAQLVAPRWDAAQFEKIVWPTKTDPYLAMRFATEELATSVIADVRARHGIGSNRVFTLGWSSGGPAAYALSLDPACQIAGSMIAMSVYPPEKLAALSAAKGRAFYLLQSPQDFIPFSMSEKARDELTTQGARVKLVTYEGGHGWHGDVYGQIRQGLLWLSETGAGR